MSFEIYVTTIATGLLSFLGRWVFTGLSFFRKCIKKPEIAETRKLQVRRNNSQWSHDQDFHKQQDNSIGSEAFGNYWTCQEKKGNPEQVKSLILFGKKPEADWTLFDDDQWQIGWPWNSFGGLQLIIASWNAPLLIKNPPLKRYIKRIPLQPT